MLIQGVNCHSGELAMYEFSVKRFLFLLWLGMIGAVIITLAIGG